MKPRPSFSLSITLAAAVAVLAAPGSGAGEERRPHPLTLEEALSRALARNYAQYGIFVLHGQADDNVPVSQARTMLGVPSLS